MNYITARTSRRAMVLAMPDDARAKAEVIATCDTPEWAEHVANALRASAAPTPALTIGEDK